MTPTEALGVALSTGPMSDKVMSECQEAAVPMVEHLRRMGFSITSNYRAVCFTSCGCDGRKLATECSTMQRCARCR